MATNNSINQRTEALAVGPIGTPTPDPTAYLITVQKDQASVTGIITLNTNSGGFSGTTVQSDGNRASGIYQYASAYSDSYGSTGDCVIFSDSAAGNMNIVCENLAKAIKLRLVTNNTGPVVTDYVLLDSTGGQYLGRNTNTAPSAGFIGELISATATTGSLTNNTVTNVTNVSLTAGTWGVSAVCSYATTGTVAGTTQWFTAISTANNNLTGVGENGATQDGGKIPVSGINSVSCWTGPTRVTLSGSTTHYLNCRGFAGTTFTNVTCTGIIRAVRVA